MSKLEILLQFTNPLSAVSPRPLPWRRPAAAASPSAAPRPPRRAPRRRRCGAWGDGAVDGDAPELVNVGKP